MLDVSFNDESLAQLLGIPSNKTLLRQHLMLSFMDVIGPVCAQGKLDARKSKHFHHLEPIWRPKVSYIKSSCHCAHLVIAWACVQEYLVYEIVIFTN